MIFNRLRAISHKNQFGYTLMELVIAIGIIGIVSGVVTMTIYQVFAGNAGSYTHMTAVKEVQSAVYWISLDTKMAQTVQTTSDDFPLQLDWEEWDSTTKRVIYTINGEDLERTVYIDGTEDSNRVIASHIDSGSASVVYADDKLTLTITASLTGFRSASETRVVEILLRTKL